MTNNANTIVRIEDRQEMAGEGLINTYHYLLNSTEPAPDLNALAEGFDTTVIQVMKDSQASSLRHTELYLKTVNRGSLEHTEAINTDGALTAVNPMPSFVACSVKLFRSDTSTRNGYKRIAGMWDEGISNNVFTAAALADFATDFLVPMLATITTTDGDWRPIIFGNVIDEVSGLSRVNFISSGIVNAIATTQRSRKQEVV